ncbi:hypothetical protein CMU30_17105 [Elizabethkingia anophelis]|nr:hypothetical protein [Elizabethkingia anophelis]MDV3683572.1 hypothetical protein [Elizabethkingia anophelis]MDV3702407.1 hypothetical protein [Elizabethkingia anophelis]MDV3761453.1 hypothetical protein [Elizabethkingia anophelis]MDV3803269.1 hypothetical protein [Elizabethkingia anophelis]
MIKRTLLFFFISISTCFFSQIKSQINREKVEIEVINRKVDSLISAQHNLKEKILEERISQATETITNQNSVISSFGTLYTIITIVLALLGIVLPILTYQFGIKPSRDALKEFEEKSEKRFNDFLRGKMKKEINRAIENLENKDNQIKNNAINFLQLNSHQGFNQDQILKILKIINDEGVDEETSNKLLYCISCQKNEDLKGYYIEYLKTSNKFDKIYYCILFFSYYEYREYKEYIKQFILNNEDEAAYLTVASCLVKHSKKDFHSFFLNDNEIIDNLSSNVLNMINQNNLGRDRLFEWKIKESDYKETHLYEKLKSTFPYIIDP